MKTIDRATMKVIVDDCVNKVDNELSRQNDFGEGLTQRAAASLARKVRQAIRETLMIVVCVLLVGCASAGRLPPNTSIEGTIAVRGDQVVQALRQVLPTLKPYVCLPGTLPGTLCIKPVDADRVAQHLMIAFGAAEGLATSLKIVDDARTAGEREVGMARVREYVRSPCKRPSLEPRSCLATKQLG